MGGMSLIFLGKTKNKTNGKENENWQYRDFIMDVVSVVTSP